MDIPNLLISLDVEIPNFLTRGRSKGLFEIRAQPTPPAGCSFGDARALTQSPGAVGRMELAIEIRERGCELVGKAVLLVDRDGLLDCVVADHVALCEVFGKDAGAWLILLLEVVVILVFGLGCCAGLASG